MISQDTSLGRSDVIKSSIIMQKGKQRQEKHHGVELIYRGNGVVVIYL